MEQNRKSSDSSIILRRAQMLGEDQIPEEVWDSLVSSPEEKMIFLTVADPDRWPEAMRPLRKWIEDNVPPEYWAEFEEE